MKNVEVFHSRVPTFRVPIQGLPPLSGWAVRYVSGMEGTPDIAPGDWLSRWHVGGDDVVFNFEHGLHMCFNEETDATRAADYLLKAAEIKTAVVKVGI
jgi:hypothetical protein